MVPLNLAVVNFDGANSEQFEKRSTMLLLILFIVLKFTFIYARRYSVSDAHVELRIENHSHEHRIKSIQRSYNSIAKVITGNPYIHHRNIYSKTDIYPRQPFWNFKQS